jgi:NADPH-dependent curcumin reductase CurA
MVQNKGLIYKNVPQGWPKEDEDLVIEAREFDLNAPPPKGGLTLKNYYVSFDPFQRGRMRDPSIKSYSPPYQLGKPITNRAISKVLKSDSPKFKEGDVIMSQDGFNTE